jgi:hypothetical protein
MPACHYCPARATTRDHIVPRLYMRRWTEHFELLPVNNIVPACEPCNNRKAAAKSACCCDACLAAWSQYGPNGWRTLPTVDPSAEMSNT